MSDLGRPVMRIIDEHLVALNRTTAAHEDHLKSHDETIALVDRRVDEALEAFAKYQQMKGKADRMRDRRIDKLVERVDALYTRVHALEKKTRET